MDHQQKIINVMILPPLDGEKMKTVDQIKKEIKAVMQIPEENQLLFLNDADDEQRLRFLYDSANLEPLYPPATPVQTSALKLVFATLIKPRRKLSLAIQLKDKVAGHEEGEVISVKMKSDTTVPQLMEWLDKEVGIPPTRQTLSFQIGANKKLPMNKEDCELGYRWDCKLEDVMPEGIEEHKVVLEVRRQRDTNAADTVELKVVFPSGEEETVVVEANHDTVSSLKHEIKHLRPDLIEEGSSLTLLMDKKGQLHSTGAYTLNKFNVKSGDKILVTINK